jgi:hypothetical protein
MKSEFYLPYAKDIDERKEMAKRLIDKKHIDMLVG